MHGNIILLVGALMIPTLRTEWIEESLPAIDFSISFSGDIVA